jgi:2-hydroxychromene-2-carboxylate isomerase
MNSISGPGKKNGEDKLVSSNKPVIEFIFDFGSPNAYLAWKILPDIAARAGAEVKIIPCLLGGIFKATGNQAPFTAFAGVKGKLAYEMLEMRRFIARHKLTAFKLNPHFPVNTLLIMRALVAASRAGVENAYLRIVAEAMWEQGEKMDDPEVFRRVLKAGGLDAEKLLAATQDAQVKAELAANTEAAVARGAFGIPTFFVGEEMFFGKERLGQVEEAVLSSARKI